MARSRIALAPPPQNPALSCDGERRVVQLQAGRARDASFEAGVELATLVGERHNSMRPDRLIGSADLVDVLPVIEEQVAVVVALSNPLKFAHSKLRRKLEGSFTAIALRGKSSKAVTSDQEPDLVFRGDPRGIAASAFAVLDGDADFRLDQVGHGANDNSTSSSDRSHGVEAERLTVNAESEAAVALELVASQSIVAEFERTRCDIQEIFFDIGVVAESFNLVDRGNHHEEIAALSAERLGEKILAKERSELIERAEIHLGIGQRVIERLIDFLGVAGEKVIEGDTLFGQKLDTGTLEKRSANVGVHDLKDSFFQSHLSLEIGTFERRTAGFYANARTAAAQRLQLVLVFGGTDFIGISTLTAELRIVSEFGLRERSRHDGALLDDRADDIRNVRNSSTLEDVHVGRLAGKNFADLSYDAVDIFSCELSHSAELNTIIWHNF